MFICFMLIIMMMVMKSFFSSSSIEGKKSILRRIGMNIIIQVPQASPGHRNLLGRAPFARRSTPTLTGLKHVGGHWEHVGHFLHLLCHCSCFDLGHHPFHTHNVRSLLKLLMLLLLWRLRLLLLTAELEVLFLFFLLFQEPGPCSFDVPAGLALLEVSPPVVLDLIVCPPWEASCDCGPSAHIIGFRLICSGYFMQ